MNPWLEDYWRDIHAKLLVYAADAINPELPPGLRARIDERLEVESEDEGGKSRQYLPDVAITEAWDRPGATVIGSRPGGVAVATPVIVHLDTKVLRHLEIVDSREHVITALEVVSPTSKSDFEHAGRWTQKRRDYLRGGINVVEIDLLYGGIWILPARGDLRPVPAGRVYHHVCVTRRPWMSRVEFYVLPLRERLPAIRVPLRQGEPDVALDLQALIDMSYERGRYGEVIDYSKEPCPPLPEEEAAWARERVAGSPAP